MMVEGSIPSAAIALVAGDRVVWAEAFGESNLWSHTPATTNTVYLIGSTFKAMSAVALLQQMHAGKFSLDDPVNRYLNGLTIRGERQSTPVTFRHLLTHTSGLPAGATLRGEGKEERLARAARFPIYPPAGAREEYSDVGYVLLWVAAERAAGEPLQGYLERRLYGPLGMSSTGFLPGLDCERCAPTGRLRDQSLYRGKPFDPIAQRLDGIAGSAGLFSTAGDIARFVAMLAGGGELDGVRILSPEAVREFMRVQVPGNRHALGWEVYCGSPRKSDESEGESGCDVPSSIGHTGWTGTSIRIDSETGAWVVLLTNRTYEPRAPNRLAEVRREIFARAVEIARGTAPVAAP